jgi:hypothetical protein
MALGAVVAAAGGGIWLGLRRDVRAPAGQMLFRPWQYAVVSAVGRRIVSPIDIDVAPFADRYAADLPSPEREDLLKFIWVVEHGAPLLSGFWSRFTSLAPADQDQVLADLEVSDMELLRAGFQALKAVCFLAHYRMPQSWPAIGYAGPVVVWDQADAVRELG